MVASVQSIRAWRKKDLQKPPIFLQYRSSSTFILSTICIAVFTDIFLYTIVVPVIPFALQSRVGVVSENVQHWVSLLLAVYGAALLGASPLCGWLADRLPNRRIPLLAGFLSLAGATLMLCLGKSLGLLLAGRVLQGISAAVVWTVGLALLADTVGHDKIGQAIGYTSISMSVSILVGPLLGGVVYDRAGYYPVYYMAFGLIILDILLRLALIEKKVAKQWETKLSPVNMTASSLPLPSPKVATAPTSQDIHKHSKQKRASPPILTLLKSRRLLAALFCTLAQSILYAAWDAVLPLYTAHLFNFTSLGGGLIFLPLIIPNFIAPLIGHWADKRGPRVPTTLGFTFAIPFLILLRFVDHAGLKQIVLLCALLVLIGFAVITSMTPLLAEITYVISHKEKTHPGAFGGKGAYATAYGLFNTAFAGGMLLGPIWAGFVLNRAGWGTMCWSLSILSFAGAVVSALFVGGWVGDERRKQQQKDPTVDEESDTKVGGGKDVV